MEKALPLYRRAGEIWLASLGPDHRFLAINDHQEASARYALGQLAQAETLLVRSIATWERAVGPDYPTVADTLELYAQVLEESGRPQEAAVQRQRLEALRGEVSESTD